MEFWILIVMLAVGCIIGWQARAILVESERRTRPMTKKQQNYLDRLSAKAGFESIEEAAYAHSLPADLTMQEATTLMVSLKAYIKVLKEERNE